MHPSFLPDLPVEACREEKQQSCDSTQGKPGHMLANQLIWRRYLFHYTRPLLASRLPKILPVPPSTLLITLHSLPPVLVFTMLFSLLPSLFHHVSLLLRHLLWAS